MPSRTGGQVRPRRQGWLSLDRIERRDAMRQVIRRVAAERHLPDREITAALGYTESRGRRMLTPGELPCFALADAALICEILGSDELLEDMASSRGYRLVRDVADRTTSNDVLGAAASAMGQAAQLVAEVTGALPDGIDPGERRAILSKIDETRRALNALEARVDVQPLRSTR